MTSLKPMMLINAFAAGAGTQKKAPKTLPPSPLCLVAFVTPVPPFVPPHMPPSVLPPPMPCEHAKMTSGWWVVSCAPKVAFAAHTDSPSSPGNGQHAAASRWTRPGPRQRVGQGSCPSSAAAAAWPSAAAFTSTVAPLLAKFPRCEWPHGPAETHPWSCGR